MTSAEREQERGHESLVGELCASGRLPAVWRPAFAALDRAMFLPRRIWVRGDDVRGGDGYVPVDRRAEPARWRAAAYADAPVVTQVSDPGGSVAHRPTSSASMPRVVARMLGLLQARDGHSVLEAGTGTGWNAALLAHRLRDEKVTTIETDRTVARRARAALSRAGHQPAVVVGDASLGHGDRAPYDRVIATYAVHTVPYAWVAQTRPGGVVVVPWGTGLYNGVLLQLTVRGDGSALGHVVDDSAFMWDRGQRPGADVVDGIRHASASASASASAAEESRTALDPRRVLGDDDMAFTAGVLVPGARYSVGHGPGGEFTLWLGDERTGAWASVDYEPDADEFTVQQHGPRRLWREVEAAYGWWLRAGSPARTRYGLTVTPAGQRLWLDAPDHSVHPPPLR